MQRAYLAHKLLFGGAYIEQGLPRLRLTKKDYEVNRMALAQRNADLRIVLESADAGTMAD